MAIICISRELAAGGGQTALELAAANGYRIIERDEILAELERHNITRETFSNYDEKKPGFRAALSENKDMYIHYLKQAIYSEAVHGDCIIVGRGAGAILRDIPGVIAVLIVAPHEARIEYLQKTHSRDAKICEQEIKQSDQDRRGYHKYFFNVDWQDPLSYDLTINTGKMRIPDAVGLIEKLRHLKITPEKEAKGKAVLANILLQRLVSGEILYARRSQIRNLVVDVSEGSVSLSGLAISHRAEANALEAVRAIPGVKSVSSDIVAVPPVPSFR